MRASLINPFTTKLFLWRKIPKNASWNPPHFVWLSRRHIHLFKRNRSFWSEKKLIAFCINSFFSCKGKGWIPNIPHSLSLSIYILCYHGNITFDEVIFCIHKLYTPSIVIPPAGVVWRPARIAMRGWGPDYRLSSEVMQIYQVVGISGIYHLLTMIYICDIWL